MALSPLATPWLEDFGEPSLMTTGICPMSVFDKFDWDSDLLGDDSDRLLEEISIKAESEEDTLCDKNTINFGSLSSIFPDLLDDMTRSNSSSSMPDIDCVKLPSSPPPSPLSLTSSNSLFSDSENCNSVANSELKFNIKEESVEVSEDFDTESLLSAFDNCAQNSIESPSFAFVPHVKTENEDNGGEAVAVSALTSATPTIKPATVSSIIRIPVQRNPNGIVNSTGRLKAVVVCPDRSKSIVCNVVRSTNKGIVIQKPISRSWLNVCGNIRSEATKLPIKVNVITSKDVARGNFKDLFRAELSADRESILTPSNLNPTVVKAASVTLTSSKIKTEAEEIRPETPQSLVGSDEENFPFSSPSKNSGMKSLGDTYQDEYLKSCLLEEENLFSDSLKCFPPAEVTGQIQPVIPDIFKYTPNSSPTSNGLQNSDSMLDSFYSKIDANSNSSNHNYFYNKAAANVDHDYGFTCRTPNTKSTNSLASIFNVDNLGIQTPSASEPPTDSDDDDTLLNDLTLLNKDMDCNELDREQREYFENLRRQLKLTELVGKVNGQKDIRTGKVSNLSLKERKLANRNRKRKLSRERSSISALSKSNETLSGKVTSSSCLDVVGASGTVKMRLPVRDVPSKKRKSSGGGRIFSPSERHMHNTNEQVRRIEMRQSFEELRQLIPNLVEKPRAPKVSILQEAKSYCEHLFEKDLELQAQVTALRLQQERLRNNLSHLRKRIAASRH